MHPAITQALYESQLQTINMLRAFVATRQKADGVNNVDFMTIVDEFSKSLKNPVIKVKKDPSNYNLFIRDRINEYKKMYPQSNGHELMRMATTAWKDKKYLIK